MTGTQRLDFRIAMITAQWHADHVDAAASSFREQVAALGVDVDKGVESSRFLEAWRSR